MKILIITVSLFVLFFSAFGYVKSKYPNLAGDISLTEIEEFFAPDQNQPIDSDTQITNPAITAQSNNIVYAEYTPELVKNANKGAVVLFFYADWCPTCRSADRIFTKKIDELPQGLTLLKVNYDNEPELKAKYDIRKQHTFVQVDSAGTEISKWTGGAVDGLKANLVRY